MSKVAASVVVPVTAFDGTDLKLCNWGGTNYPRNLEGMYNSSLIVSSIRYLKKSLLLNRFLS